MVKLNVYQHWDPLKICIVGRSYDPEFYSYIENPRVRSVLERIAVETEEDYQALIKVLQKFGVEVWRPTVWSYRDLYLRKDGGGYKVPPMNPRDWGGMIGDTFYWDQWSTVGYEHILSDISATNRIELSTGISTNQITRVGRDLYIGTESQHQYRAMLAMQESMQQEIPAERWTEVNGVISEEYRLISQYFPQYRKHLVDSEGHTDGTFCPVTPGLIISLFNIQKYSESFPDWEVVYLPDQSWSLVYPFLDLKKKNGGKWWVPGEETNDELTDFVEQWLSHWVGYVEETVFDVNMLMIDQQNVIVNNYNKQVFDAFDRYGITAHIVNFRHRYFWDGGIHCITQDVHRDGVMQDWFPTRV